MPDFRNIKALFFLGVFCMFLMHQVVPYWHHHHSHDHHHGAVSHNHQHEHHHDKSEEGNSESGFLDWFLKMHVHSSAGFDLIHNGKITLNKIPPKNVIVKLFEVAEIITSKLEDSKSVKKWLDPPDINQYLLTSRLVLRGPPVTG